jgi:hypothetical protein
VGTDYRLHLALDLGTMTLHQVHVTGPDQGESLARYAFEEGDVVMADRGYNQPQAILDLHERGVYTVVRLLPTAMPLYLRQEGEEAFDPAMAHRLSLADELRTTLGNVATWPVWLTARSRAGAGWVHALRLPPEAARRRCRQDARRKGRTPSQDALYLAGWVMIFTTVPPSLLEGVTLLELYRTRWQVELALKRLKSVLDLDELRVKQGSLMGEVWPAESYCTPAGMGQPSGKGLPESKILPRKPEMSAYVCPGTQSQLRTPPVWYSVTRVSKKFFSFLRSRISLIQGNGLVAPGYCSGRPIWAQRRLAMYFR